MVADDDCKHQEEITDISRRSLIVAADWERTADKLDRNIFYVVVVRLIGFQGRSLVETEAVEDTEEDEIGKYHNMNSISEYLTSNLLFPRENIAESRGIQHRS